MGGSRDPHGAAVPQAAHHLQPPLVLGRVERVWRRSCGFNARMGKGLGLRAAGGGPGLVPRPKFETAPPIRAPGPAIAGAKERLAGPGPPGGDAAVAVVLDYFASQRITDRSRPGRESPGLSGSSEEGTKPIAPKGRAPRPCGGGCRASTKTVTRRGPAVPPLSHRVSRAEKQRVRVGSESRATRRADSCGANQRRSSRA
jgi:hypothetical protein